MRKLVAINPTTEEELGSYALHSSRQIEKALIGAVAQFESWKKASFEQRAQVLNGVADVIEKRLEELSRLVTLEMGKPLTESRTEVQKCADGLRYFGQNAQEFLAPYEVRDLPGTTVINTKARVRYEPLGVVLGIFPWNFPWWQTFRAAAPTLMAGNVMVMKHASNVPASAAAMEEVFNQAGAPKGLFTNLFMDSKRTEKLIGDSRIRAVTFTGSTSAGARVGAAAGRAVKKSVLELGGSDPFVVFADANLEEAAVAGAKMRLRNTGQSCICAKRFIVEASVYEKFSNLLSRQMGALSVGDPMDEATLVGPLARKDLRDTLQLQLESALKHGDEVIYQGSKSFSRGYFFNPTLVRAKDEASPLLCEETFGPLASVISFKDEREAIRLANATNYGLAGSVWSGNLHRGENVARGIYAGTVFVNAAVSSSFNLPFGGVKQSGYGRELGREGIREFTNIQVVAQSE